MTDLKNAVSRIKNTLSSVSAEKKTWAAVLLGITGILLIFFSGGDDEKNDAPVISEGNAGETAELQEYNAYQEKRLEDILSAIDGVGQVRVMITLDSTEEYIYAESEDIDNERKESEYVIIKNQDGEEALVKKIMYPEITGVVVVCDGGGSDRVRERIYNAVTAVMGITSDKIYVAKME